MDTEKSILIKNLTGNDRFQRGGSIIYSYSAFENQTCIFEISRVYEEGCSGDKDKKESFACHMDFGIAHDILSFLFENAIYPSHCRSVVEDLGFQIQSTAGLTEKQMAF